MLRTKPGRVHLYQGSVLTTPMLGRLAVRQAVAVFVFANRNAPDPDAEDAANILRVVAIKNFCCYGDTNGSRRAIEYISLRYFSFSCCIHTLGSWILL